MENLKVKLFYPDAKVPTRGSEEAAGYDLYSYEDKIIQPMKSAMIDTGIGVTVPKGTYGRIAPRSSVSMKSMFVNAGVCDRDFCGNIRVIMQNLGDKPFEVKKNDRIAQLILEQIKIVPIEVVEELNPTERGSKGYGSTGR